MFAFGAKEGPMSKWRTFSLKRVYQVEAKNLTRSQKYSHLDSSPLDTPLVPFKKRENKKERPPILPRQNNQTASIKPSRALYAFHIRFTKEQLRSACSITNFGIKILTVNVPLLSRDHFFLSSLSLEAKEDRRFAKKATIETQGPFQPQCPLRGGNHSLRASWYLKAIILLQKGFFSFMKHHPIWREGPYF